MSYQPVSSPAILVPVPLPTGTNAQDATFLQQASQSNSLEIAEGTLALQKATSPAAQQFANWMIVDHSGAGATLALLAQALGVTLPSTFTTAQATEFNTLAAASGPSFDGDYAVSEITDHRATLALFRQEVAAGENPAVVAFASQLIPTLEAHLASSEQLATAVTGVALPVDTVTPPTPLTSDGPALGTPSAQDTAFVQTASLANMAEVAQSQLATAQTGNPAAVQFANWMIADHSGAEAGLTTLAGQEGLTLPSGLDPANEQLLTQLRPLTDGAFFASYVAGQIIAHTQSLTAFIQESQFGQDTAIKAYASAGIPTLSGHLASALTLEKTTPGAASAAPAIDQGLTSLLNTAAASGNPTLFNDLRQIAALQPGFTYPGTTTSAAGAALPASATAMQTMMVASH
jgi:putative membrane protein